jgi:hypothetical protein
MSTSLLGFGFNIYGRMDLSDGVTESVVMATDDNLVTSPPDQATIHNSHVSSSREEVTEQFAASVGLNYSSIAFDGEFSAKYNQDSESSSEVMYGMYEVLHPVASTRLLSTDTNQYSGTFGSDPDVVGLPDTFDPANPEQFFRIFRRYGTHFVTEITLGGRLSAYTTAKLTKEIDSSKATADMRVEYEALFGSASANASTEWAKVESSWGSDRNVSFETIGGDAQGLANFVPDYNASAGDQVAAWLGSVKDNPGIINYRLAELSKLFVGQTALAVHKAIDAFLSSIIRVNTWHLYSPATSVEATPTPKYASTISVPGQAVMTEPTNIIGPVPTSGDEVRWIWLVLMDPNKLDTKTPILNAVYYLNGQDFADKINSDITNARSILSDPLVLMSGEIDAYSNPSNSPRGLVIPTQLQELVQECGFDLQSIDRPSDNEVFAPHHIVSLIGLANTANPCVVTIETSVGELVSTPARSVAQYLDGDITVIDQFGTALSPVAS